MAVLQRLAERGQLSGCNPSLSEFSPCSHNRHPGRGGRWRSDWWVTFLGYNPSHHYPATQISNSNIQFILPIVLRLHLEIIANCESSRLEIEILDEFGMLLTFMAG